MNMKSKYYLVEKLIAELYESEEISEVTFRNIISDIKAILDKFDDNNSKEIA